MKNLIQKLRFALVIALTALALGTLCASALPARTAAATSPEGYAKMVSLIGKQNFAGYRTRDEIVAFIKHYTYDSDYAAYYQKEFPYKNTMGYYNSNKEFIVTEWHPSYETISDGTYTSTGRAGQGCCLYSRHVTLVIYGSEGPRLYLAPEGTETRAEAFKRLLQTNAQAGEHIRIDNTHSITFVSCDDGGFYYFNYEYNAWNVITMNYISYEDFLDNDDYTGKGIWIYNSNANVNDPNAQPTPAAPSLPSDTAHTTPAPVCYHPSYNASGNCKDCGAAFPITVTNLSPVKYVVTKNSPIRLRPYATWKNPKCVLKNDVVTLVGYGYNSRGNLWYLAQKDDEYDNQKFWIYSKNIAQLNEVNVTLKEPINANSITIQVNAGCSYTTQRPDRVGLLVGTTKKNMKLVAIEPINHRANPFDIWYKVADYMDINADTVYYYQFVTEFDSLKYSALIDKDTLKSKIGTFMVPSFKEETTVTKPNSDPIDDATAGLLEAIVPVKLTVKSVSSLTSTSARFNASCTYIGNRPTYVCLYLGLSADESNMWQVGYDTINHSKNPFDIWYDVSGMAENHVYYYQFRAEADGKLYKSDVHTVTTMNKAPIDNAMDSALGALGALSGNTRIGVVTGTGSSHLAINNKPAASPTYSTEIGTIPPGAKMTVHTDKQSGNWYYVTYNGISGYAYGKYIALQ